MKPELMKKPSPLAVRARKPSPGVEAVKAQPSVTHLNGSRTDSEVSGNSFKTSGEKESVLNGQGVKSNLTGNGSKENRLKPAFVVHVDRTHHMEVRLIVMQALCKHGS